MKVAIKDIKSNPFRDLNRYHIDPEKVAVLVESIGSTGFWNNIMGRVNGDGRPEIAYGHHRLAALKKFYKKSKGNHKIDLIIKDLTNEDMIQIMARENMEEWAHNVIVEQETVRATIQAFADGKIELPEVSEAALDKDIRYAPSFKREDAAAGRVRRYTSFTLGKFLGWLHKPDDEHPQGEADKRLRRALQSLSLIEDCVLDEKDFIDLGARESEAILRQVRITQDRHKDEEDADGIASRVGKGLAELFRAGELAINGVPDAVFKIDPRQKKIPEINQFCEKLGAKFDKMLMYGEDKLSKELDPIVENKQYADADSLLELVNALEAFAARIEKYVSALRGETSETKLIEMERG